jgi:hypothetical protein
MRLPVAGGYGISRIDPAEGGGYLRYPWLMKLKFQKRSDSGYIGI